MTQGIYNTILTSILRHENRNSGPLRVSNFVMNKIAAIRKVLCSFENIGKYNLCKIFNYKLSRKSLKI